jgi:hypothetical protein
MTKLQNQHIAIPHTILKDQESQQLLIIRLVTIISSCQIETTEIPISNILFWFTYNGHLLWDKVCIIFYRFCWFQDLMVGSQFWMRNFSPSVLSTGWEC